MLRLILSILLCAVLCSPQDITVRRQRPAAAVAGITVAAVRNGTAFNNSDEGSVSTSSTMNVASGGTIAVFCRANARSDFAASVADTASNSYTKVAVTFDSNLNQYGVWFLASNITGNSANTVTCTLPVAGSIGVIAYYLTGVAASSAVDTSVTNKTDATTSVSASFSTSQNVTIALYGVSTVSDSTSFTAGSGYTIPENGTLSTGRGATQYQIFSTTQSSVTATITLSAWMKAGNIVMALKGAS